MKLIKISASVLLCFLVLNIDAQVLVNNGSVISVKEGSKLIVEGSYHNYLDGNIANAGNIYLSGNWINNALSGNLLQNTSGIVTFSGPAMQLISGNNTTWFSNLFISNDVELACETSVSTLLNISNADLNLKDYNLILEENAQIAGYSDSSYIIAENEGRLKRTVTDVATEFPVGTASSYVPVILENAGTVDLFGVNVFSDVLENGISGATISQIDHCVNNTWSITEQESGGSNLTITVEWNENIEGCLFNRLHCGIGNYYGNAWNPQISAEAIGSNPYRLTRSAIESFSAFAVGDSQSPMAVSANLILDLKAFLEGPFNGADLNTFLNSSGYIPLLQPYSGIPWNYTGTETVTSVPNASIVDWVLVELRDAVQGSQATTSTTIDRKVGFLLNNGAITGTDGVTPLQFGGLTVQNGLFVFVNHRNHIAVMNPVPLVGTSGVYSWNFTTADLQAYGGNLAHKELLPGYWGMTAGDGNSDNQVNNSDKNNVWKPQSGSSGYMSGDFNLDSQVNNVDKNLVWKPNTGSGGQVPD